MSLSVVTWNINSVRLRIGLVTKLLERWQPDVLCLQETKCPQGQFPSAPIRDTGYQHIAEFGQKAKDIRRAYEQNDAVPELLAEIRKSKAMDWLLHHVEMVDTDGNPIDRDLVLGHTHDHDDDDDHDHDDHDHDDDDDHDHDDHDHDHDHEDDDEAEKGNAE